MAELRVLERYSWRRDWNGPKRAAKGANATAVRRWRGSSTAAPREIWSGLSSFSPGWCVSVSSISYREAQSCSRLSNSWVPNPFD